MGVSSSKGDYQSARFIKNGADDFLSKPFCPEEFYCRVIQNIEKLQYLEEIKAAANTDFLTSIPNRRHFIELVNAQLKDPQKDGLVKVLAVAHIDDFKTLNDTHKHKAGDEVLLSFAKRLTNNFSNNAVVARLSGAEFAVFAVEEESSNIEKKLQHLQDETSKNGIKHGDTNINFTVSIGGTVVEADADFHIALAAAVETLKKATSKGKNKLLIEEISKN